MWQRKYQLPQPLLCALTYAAGHYLRDPCVLILYLCIRTDTLTCCAVIHNLRWSNSSFICTPTALGKQSEEESIGEKKYRCKLGTEDKYLH